MMRNRLVARFVVVLFLTVAPACATVDSFNKAAARLTHDAIVASEANRCTVHAAPCLTDAQFRGVNVELNKISVAGREFTKLRIAGKASAKDATTFLSTVAEEVAVLSRTYTDGSIKVVLDKLTALQARAVKLIGA